MALSLVEVKEVPRSARGEWAEQYIPLVEQFRNSDMQAVQVTGVPTGKEVTVMQAIKRYIDGKHINTVHVCVRQKKLYLIKVNE